MSAQRSALFAPRLGGLAPLVFASVMLVASALSGTDSFNGLTIWAVVLELAVPLFLLAARRPERPADLWRVPCLLAPLATIYPWAVVPSHLGMAVGGLPLFLGWLTRYPNFGPVNGEILLGIGCVLGASAMPVLFAELARRRPGRPGLLLGVLLLGLVPYVPVLLRLDIELVLAGILGVPSLFSDAPISMPWLAAGPGMRALGVVGMVVGTAGAFSERRAQGKGGSARNDSLSPE